MGRFRGNDYVRDVPLGAEFKRDLPSRRVYLPSRRVCSALAPRFFRHRFRSATIFNGDIGDWDVSQVRDMFYMLRPGGRNASRMVRATRERRDRFADRFARDRSPREERAAHPSTPRRRFGDEDHHDFNQDLSSWDMSAVTDIRYMFAHAAIDQDLGWCLADDVTDTGTFYNSGCGSAAACGVPGEQCS